MRVIFIFSLHKSARQWSVYWTIMQMQLEGIQNTRRARPGKSNTNKKKINGEQIPRQTSAAFGQHWKAIVVIKTWLGSALFHVLQGVAWIVFLFKLGSSESYAFVWFLSPYVSAAVGVGGQRRLIRADRSRAAFTQDCSLCSMLCVSTPWS